MHHEQLLRCDPAGYVACCRAVAAALGEGIRLELRPLTLAETTRILASPARRTARHSSLAHGGADDHAAGF